MKRKIKILLAVVSAILITAIIGTLLGILIPARRKNREEAEIIRQAQAYYDAKVAAFAQENLTVDEVDVAFIGDSITDGYNVSAYYPQYKTVNRGISGDTTFGVEKRLKVSLYDIQPKVVVMLIGANNYKTMFLNYESILQQLQTNLPDSKIVLLSLTAMSKEWGRNNDAAILNNQKIKSLAVKYGYTFVDMFTPLCNPDTGEMYESYSVDGGHPTPEGYEVMTSVLTPVLNELLPR